MRRIALVLVALVILGVAVTGSVRAEDPTSAEARLAALEKRLAHLEAQLATLQQRLDALLAQRASPPAPPLAWTTLRDEDHLTSKLEAAAKEGKPVVVSVHAPWCTYCLAFDDLIQGTPSLRAGFEGLVRLRIDVTNAPREDLRKVAGIGAGQPKMVFFDAKGEPVEDAKITHWHREKSAEILGESLEKITR